MPSITVTWPTVENEHGWDMLWFGAWLVGSEGTEGPWFYNGRGGESATYEVPPVATGVRFRRWPNEGLDAEYADLLEVPVGRTLSADELDYDRRQPFAVIPGVE